MATTYDFYIHPSHGIAADGSFGDHAIEETSAAEKLLAALAASMDNTVDDDDATVCDLVMDDSEGGDFSDYSLDTPSSSFSNLQSIKDEANFSFFPDVEAAKPVTAALQRISSCSFTPDATLLEASLAPVSETLQAQLSAASEERSTTPTFGGFSMIAQASTSSGMLRSFSAPVQSIAEYKATMVRWNMEAAEASTSAVPDNELPDSPRRQYAAARPSMQRRATAGNIYSSRKGKLPIRRSSAFGEDRPIQSYLDVEEDSEEGPTVQDTFSSREHLLSPTKKHSPFKRSRLSYSSVHAATVYEDPRESEFNPTSSNSGRPTTPHTGDQACPPSPPKSPTRPALNRHFTSPEFWIGGEADAVF